MPFTVDQWVEFPQKTWVKANIPVIDLKEGDAFICYSPAFDLAAHRESFEDAEQSFTKTLKLSVEQVTKKGTWQNVLEEYGWMKVKKGMDAAPYYQPGKHEH